MALLDPRIFDPSTYNGGMLGTLLERLNFPQPQPSQGFPGQGTVTPNGVTAPEQNAVLPPNAQPTGPAVPEQRNILGDSFRGLIENAHTGPIGALLGGIGAGAFGNSSNETARVLESKGIDPALAKTIARDPGLMRSILPHLIAGKSGTVINNRLVNPINGKIIADFSDTKAPETKEFETAGGGKVARQYNTKTGQWESIPGIDGGGAGKPPAGYQWVDPQNPSKGVSAIAGGPATHLPAETAGRIAMMDTAMSGFAGARKELERSWGPIDRAMSVLGAGDIGRAQRTARTAIEATLRAMTGAAAPETEVARYMDLFMPGQLDTPQTAKQKLDLLEGFMKNAKSTVTQGRVPASDMGWTDLGNGVRIREKK